MVQFKFLILNNYKKDRIIIPHGHNCYEFVYYIQASGTLYSSYSKTSIKSNYQRFYNENLSDLPSHRFSSHSFTLIPPHTLHNEIHEQDASIVAIGFDVSDNSLIIDTSNTLDVNHSIYQKIQKIVEEYKNKNYKYTLAIESLLTQMLIEIKREKVASAEKRDAIDFAIAYIDENFTSDIDLNKLAFDTGYSADHFRFLFKQKKDLPPKSYILDKRISMAKDLLTTSSLPIALISVYCGFERACYFTTLFKKMTNLTPQKYRDQNTKTN